MRPFDFVEPYLRAIFGFVGITDITFLRAGGMDVSTDVKKAGQRSAIAEARELARSGAWRPATATPALPSGLPASTAAAAAAAQVLVA